MEKDIIHENSNNHNKYINNENSGEKSAEQAGAVLRAMTVDDISAVKQIEQTCFSDAWSEKLLSDLLESEWDEAWVLTDTDGTRIGYANFRFLAGEGELMRSQCSRNTGAVGSQRNSWTVWKSLQRKRKRRT